MTDSSAPRVLVILGGIPLHGQERGNIEVFRTLQSRGVEALFVTHAGYGHESVQPFLDRLGLRWTTAPFAGFWSLRPGLFAERVREFVGGNVALVRAARAFRPTHVHAGNERNLLNLLPAVWWIGRPLVFRLGDAPRTHRLPFRLFWRWLLGPSISQTVCISAFVHARARGAGLPPHKLRVIRNAPPVRPPREAPTDLPPDLAAEAAGTAPPFSGRTVLYLGQLSAEKGVDRLVEAARALCAERDDVRVLIGGNFAWQNPFATDLMDALALDGLDGRIRFLGFVEDTESLHALASVLAVPSVWDEPLSNVVGEAKRAGVPSVVFPSGGLLELVLRQGADGVVCRDTSPEALADGLRQVLDLTPEALAACGEAARQSLHELGLTEAVYGPAWHAVFTGDAAPALGGRSSLALAPRDGS